MSGYVIITFKIKILFSFQAIDPEDLVVVTVGSLKEVIFQGGPQPWVLNPREYYQKGLYCVENPDRKSYLSLIQVQMNFTRFYFF